MPLGLHLTTRLRSAVLGRRVAVWHHPSYRVPLGGVETRRGLEPRRADFVRFYALEAGLCSPAQFREPPAVAWEELGRVHTPAQLERLGTPAELARIFAVDPEEVRVDELMHMARLATGGTLQASYETLSTGEPALNLLGGFHHAGPDWGGGFCPVNDVAVAIATLRAGGFAGPVGVVDVDAHPPDGTSACLRNVAGIWQGSISGASFGPLPGVDEVRVPTGGGDDTYLAALDALLSRMPRLELCFVIAGGDVLAGDPLGAVGLSMAGTMERDRRIHRRLRGVPQVWLPGGGYSERAWEVLANVLELLCTHRITGVPRGYDPLRRQFSALAGSLETAQLGGADGGWLAGEDADSLLGGTRKGPPRLLGYYTASGVEYALFRYGVLGHVQRLGYRDVHVTLGQQGNLHTVRVVSGEGAQEQVLMDIAVERQQLQDRPVLFINWLEMMHPRAAFSAGRPQLPGQRHPGLGLAKEAAELMVQMARRLGLHGVVFRPAHLHVAFGARHRFVFADAERQGRFLALLRDTAHLPLMEASRAVEDGRVTLNGEPYAWEATPMVHWLQRNPEGTPESEAPATPPPDMAFRVQQGTGGGG
jgi:acetoin utilization deacetylase AcuC-like enzyme